MRPSLPSLLPPPQPLTSGIAVAAPAHGPQLAVVQGRPVLRFFQSPAGLCSVPALRLGPSVLPTDAFRDCPWAVRCAIYWYSRRDRDGLLVVSYTDGCYGLHRLAAPAGLPVLPWQQIKTRDERVTAATFRWMRQGRASVSADGVPTPRTAIDAVWDAIAAARRARQW